MSAKQKGMIVKTTILAEGVGSAPHTDTVAVLLIIQQVEIT